MIGWIPFVQDRGNRMHLAVRFWCVHFLASKCLFSYARTSESRNMRRRPNLMPRRPVLRRARTVSVCTSQRWATSAKERSLSLSVSIKGLPQGGLGPAAKEGGCPLVARVYALTHTKLGKQLVRVTLGQVKPKYTGNTRQKMTKLMQPVPKRFLDQLVLPAPG
jgi:hypothetical protein